MEPLKLQIGTDPFPWIVKDIDYQTLAGQLAGATGPVVVPVSSPLQGRLVLSKAAGSVAVAKPDAVGWNPSDTPRRRSRSSTRHRGPRQPRRIPGSRWTRAPMSQLWNRRSWPR